MCWTLTLVPHNCIAGWMIIELGCIAGWMISGWKNSIFGWNMYLYCGIDDHQNGKENCGSEAKLMNISSKLSSCCTFMLSDDKLIFNFWPFVFLNVNAGLTALVSLNVSNSHITNNGLQHLKPLKNLLSLSLESCKVTASEIRKLQSTALPNLVSFRPE